MLSVSVATTRYDPTAGGVPRIIPVPAMYMGLGKPVEDHVVEPVPPVTLNIGPIYGTATVASALRANMSETLLVA